MADQNNVAGTILNQLGGRRFIAMTSAGSFLNLGNGLQLCFKGSRHANSVRITLDATDTYTVEFFKFKGIDCTSVEKLSVIHAESLGTVFARVTGLHISL